MLRNKTRSGSLFSATLSIAIPLALQNLIAFSVNMADTVMLGQLGDIPLSASAQANQVFFIVSLAVAGIADGANVMVSQAWGAKDTARIQNILSYTYRLALGFVFVLTFAAILFPEWIMRIYTPDPEVITAGAEYLRIVAFSYLFYTITTVSTGVLRAVRTVRIAMYGSLISMGLNVLLNWVLIFGKLGFAPMGVKGAAIATVVARIAESIVIVIYLYTKENNLHIRVRTLLQSDRTVLGPFFKTSAPIIINELFWAIGESVIAATMGQMGTEVVSANSICSVMNQMATVFVQGATAATCVIVGNTIGAGKLDELPRQKRFFQTFVLIMSTVAGLVIFFTGDFVISLYDVSAVTRQYASQMILITAVIQPFCAFQITNMMGILRGGGDVRFAMFNDLIFLWCVTIPLGFLGGVVWKLPVWLVFCLMRVEKVGKSITSELRLHSGKWIHYVNKSKKEMEEAA